MNPPDRILLLWLVAVLGVGMSNASAQSNLIKNPSFERFNGSAWVPDSNHWVLGSGSSLVAGDSKYGQYHLEIGHGFAQYGVRTAERMAISAHDADFGNGWMTVQLLIAEAAPDPSSRNALVGLRFFDENDQPMEAPMHAAPGLVWSSYLGLWYRYVQQPGVDLDWKFWSHSFKAPIGAQSCELFLYKFADLATQPAIRVDAVHLSYGLSNRLLNADFDQLAGLDYWHGLTLVNFGESKETHAGLGGRRSVVQRGFTPTYRVELRASRHWMLGASVRNTQSDLGPNDALLGIRIFDAQGVPITSGVEGLTLSPFLGNAWYQYLDTTTSWNRHFVSFQLPPEAVEGELLFYNWDALETDWDNFVLQPLHYRSGDPSGNAALIYLPPNPGYLTKPGGSPRDLKAIEAYLPYVAYFPTSVLHPLSAPCGRMLDSVVFTDTYLYGGSSASTVRQRTTKANWELYLDKLFLAERDYFEQKGGSASESWFSDDLPAVTALDRAAAHAQTELGVPVEIGVIVMLPWPGAAPASSQTDFGDVVTDLDPDSEDLSDPQDRREVIEWYVDLALQRWGSHAEKSHLRLLGFYWLDEFISGWDDDAVQHASQYIHGLDLRFYHSPYRSSTGVQSSRTLPGCFDVVWKQANVFAYNSRPKWHIRDVNRFAGSREFGLNLEWTDGDSIWGDGYLEFGQRDFHAAANHCVYESGGWLWACHQRAAKRHQYRQLYEFLQQRRACGWGKPRVRQF